MQSSLRCSSVKVCKVLTFCCGLKVTCIEKDVPGLIRIDRGIKVLKALETGGLREWKDSPRGRVNVVIILQTEGSKLD